MIAKRTTILAAASLIAFQAKADMPVIDAATVFHLVQQAKVLNDQLAQQKQTLHSLTNVPQGLVQQVEGLLQNAVANPLGNITQNLQTLMTGQGTGTCNGSQGILTENRYAEAQGGDFAAQWLNQSANRNAGIQACTQVMMQATQARLAQMPQLLNELQDAQDVTQVSAVSARINYETSVITAQQQQANTMAQMAMMQHMMAEDQQLQKMRADAQERINNTSATTGGGQATPVPAPMPFAGQ